MSVGEFLTNSLVLIGLMAVIAIVETAVPFHRNPEWRSRHLAPNLALTALMLTLNFAFNAGAIVIAAILNANNFGLLAGQGLPILASLLLGVVVLDLFSYFAHWLMHRLSWLWSVHRVHHSDPLVDITTAYRQHPLEGLVRFLFTMIPAWLLGFPAEAIVLYRLLSAANALLEHMNIKLWQPLDSLLSALYVTPNMHKVHHSRVQRETDSNYGNILAIYDRVFRTFSPTSRATAVCYGLDGLDAVELQTFGALLKLPFQPDVPTIPSIPADGADTGMLGSGKNHAGAKT
jgi:sterol desaturase/sphingolipid hydroxylase (fatty acid hydroxylase superfamily)